MPVTHVIVGLGNPGDEYEGTRHNVGFAVVDRIAERLGCGPVRDKKYGALAARGRIGSDLELLLVKPQGYMNLSGEPTRKALGDAGLPKEDWKEKLIVVHDELDLPVGRMKLQTDRGAGGHNCIKSIIGAIGTQAFVRVRIGVDKPPKGRGSDWVLGGFSKAEQPVIDEIVERAAEAIEAIARRGFDKAANEFNRDPQDAKQQK